MFIYILLLIAFIRIYSHVIVHFIQHFIQPFYRSIIHLLFKYFIVVFYRYMLLSLCSIKSKLSAFSELSAL